LSKYTSPQDILNHSTLVYSATEIEQAVDNLAKQINQQLVSSPIVMLCVMTGGLYFSGLLLSKLRMPISLDYVQVSRYQNNLYGSELNWLKKPDIELTDKIVLLVDDILDEGVTLTHVKRFCLSLGAKDVLSAVLVNKDNGLNKPIKADFTALSVPNVFVFGCGMDAFGWWRNLSEIRALI
jgi:hypoxanthine phosphoribosyltransferase